jgi:RES domain-containing protein
VPHNWNGATPIPACEAIGKAFIEEQRSLALVVPSAVTRGEENVLINPLHPRFGEIIFDTPEPFAFDPRLLRPGVSVPAPPKTP